MKTHYDVLNLDKNCTAKEIKDSFLNLSKKYHPDINKSADAHKKFVEVNEAYSILGKVDKRLRYDEALLIQRRVEYKESPGYNPNVRAYESYSRNFHKNNPVVFTASKLKVLIFCCILIVIGSGFQINGMLNNRYRRSQHIATSLRQARERNQKQNKEQKLEELTRALKKNKYKDVNTGEK